VAPGVRSGASAGGRRPARRGSPDHRPAVTCLVPASVVAPPGGVPEMRSQPVREPPAEAETLPLWAMPALDVGPQPMGPDATHLAREPGVDLETGMVDTSGPTTGPVGRSPSPETIRWWWIPKGSRSLDLGFPASQLDIRRRRQSARSISLVQPPPPLLLPYTVVVMSSRGAAPAGQGQG
jgi:hypothetical protein